MKQNKMRDIEIEKIVLSIGSSGEQLEKGEKLLKIITNKKPIKIKSEKRIPGFGVKPGLEVGTKVTLRGELVKELLKKLLDSINNNLKEEQISGEGISFGIPEYIEIPDMEYQRDIGIMGLNVNIVFKRKGKRVKIRKHKRGKIPKRQSITKKEIVKFMQDNYQTKFGEVEE
jgi:large subunit ribosomal protein L5